MNENEPQLETPFTYLLPMREDRPEFVDFEEMRKEVVDIMGPDYPRQLITRIVSIVGGANGIEGTVYGMTVHRTEQANGRPGGVKAVSFWRTPLTVERLSKHGRLIGPVAARAVVDFASKLQEYAELPLAT